MNDIYLIYGNDYGLIKREVDKLSKNFSDVVKYDLSESKVDELLDDALCMSLFGNKKLIIGENAVFLTTTNSNINHDLAYLTNYLEDENHDNIVVFTVVSDKLDERKKIVKLFKSRAKIIYKELINEGDLASFIIKEFTNQGFKIDYKTANYLVSYAGSNVDVLLKEIEKLSVYKDDDKNITIKDVDSICCRDLRDNVFELSDGIMRQDYKKIYSCYNDLIMLNEEPIKIIALLGSQFTLVYQAKLLSKEGEKEADIARILKVHPYRVKLSLETSFKIDELKTMLRRLHDLDYKIKKGEIDKNLGLENFLLHL